MTMTWILSPTKTSKNASFIEQESPGQPQNRREGEGVPPGILDTPRLAPTPPPTDPLSPLDLNLVFADDVQEGVSNFSPVILKHHAVEFSEEGASSHVAVPAPAKPQLGSILLMYQRYLSDEPKKRSLNAIQAFEHDPKSPFRLLHPPPPQKTILEAMIEANREHNVPPGSPESTDAEIETMSSDEEVILASPSKKRRL